ncbi:hypothetical protein [Zoogloea sp.]|jgi:hypothetical protein|uniref:hypothetical protein n=1 Tax=Zoogloea sp. TaxID=49181 RepID=UPI0037DA05FB
MSYIVPRHLLDAELAVLQAILSRAPASDAPRISSELLSGLMVHSKCDCGCASVGFLPEGTHPNTNTKLIADGLGLSPDNKQVGVIVYGSPGQVVELELYWHHEGGAPLPCPETIAPWERGTEIKEAEL